MKLDKFDIATLLSAIGIDVSNHNPNKDGFIIVSSPLRVDNNPSFGIHIGTGNWKDHGTKKTGNIWSLLIEYYNLNGYSEALKKAEEILNGHQSSAQPSQQKPSFSKPTPTLSISNPFWNKKRKERRKKAHQRLKNEPNHSVIQTSKHYDQIDYQTLLQHGCGIIEYKGQDYLLIPYKTGGYQYRRQNGDKQIKHIIGSSTKGSFWNQQNIGQTADLHLAKSPREGMLLSQRVDDDVIAITGNESSNISDNQKQWIDNNLSHLQRVFIYFDCDTTNARKSAHSFALQLKQALPQVAVYVVNISKASNGADKDLTDWVSSGHSLSELQGEGKKIPLTKEFWDTWNNGELKLKHTTIAKLCRKKGYRKLYLGDEPSIIKDEDGILHNSNKDRLKDAIRDMIEGLPPDLIDKEDPEEFKEQLMEKFLRNGNSIANNVQTGLHELDVDYLTDDQDCVRLFFENGVAQITAHDVSLKPYSQLDGSIWRDQKINHKIELDSSQPSKSEYAQFVYNIADGSRERFEALITTLGYLTSTHKNKANAKAVILVDQKITASDQAEGGTGKSLFAEAIKHVRNFKYIPGKSHSPSHRFAFQTIELGDQVMFIDDVRQSYKFQALFNVITNDMRVERKGKDPVTIPFELSPKIVISTNSSIGGTGNSFRRRQNIIEFSNYYNSQHTPVDDFGHRLFDEWDKLEWNKFYNFIIWSVQQFLHRGLKDFTKNYKIQKLINDTSRDMVDFYHNYVRYDQEYDKKDLFHNYQKKKPNDAMGMSQSAFTSQIKKCADYDDNVIEVNTNEPDGSRTIEFISTYEDNDIFD